MWTWQGEQLRLKPISPLSAGLVFLRLCLSARLFLFFFSFSRSIRARFGVSIAVGVHVERGMGSALPSSSSVSPREPVEHRGVVGMGGDLWGLSPFGPRLLWGMLKDAGGVERPWVAIPMAHMGRLHPCHRRGATHISPLSLSLLLVEFIEPLLWSQSIPLGMQASPAAIGLGSPCVVRDPTERPPPRQQGTLCSMVQT